MEHKTENMVYKKIRRTMKKTLQKFLSLLLVVVFSVSLSGCFKEKETPYTVSLEMWGVFDETDAYRDIIGPYLRMNPHVKTIEYRKMAVDTYERDLLDALAAGNGPDIFMIRNVWLPSFANKLAPADSAFVSEKDYRDAFVDVTADDFFSEGKAYAVPLSVDSLGLYYNKDILNAAGISSPPKTWQEVLRDIRPLSRIDEYGTIIQSALAMGTAYNVNRSTDLLSLIFLQFGVSANGFGQNQADFGNQAATDSMVFYTQFAQPSGAYYTWNPRNDYSIDAFYAGKAAMMINYSWQIETIRQKNAKLNFGIAPLPQFENTPPVNFANYWGLAVSKNKEVKPLAAGEQAMAPTGKENDLRVFEAWQFLRYFAFPHEGKVVTLYNGLTMNPKEFPLTDDPTQVYLKATKKPAARRDILLIQQGDAVLAPFASGNLIARSFQQLNPEETKRILAEAIAKVNSGEASVLDALGLAESRINLLGNDMRR
jgi:multiple sugar transport system substrate-binding protein